MPVFDIWRWLQLLISALFINDKGKITKLHSHNHCNSIQHLVQILSTDGYMLFDIRKADASERYMQDKYGYSLWFYDTWFSNYKHIDRGKYELRVWLFSTSIESEMELLDSILIPMQKELEVIDAEKTITIYQSGEISTVILSPKLDDAMIDYSR